MNKVFRPCDLDQRSLLPRDLRAPGTGAVQADCYYSKKYRPPGPRPRELHRTGRRRSAPLWGILREDDNILCMNTRVNDYANIIFDLDYRAALGTVHGYLGDVGILCCGRYGEWRHLWIDEAFESGERAAERALERMGPAAGR